MTTLGILAGLASFLIHAYQFLVKLAPIVGPTLDRLDKMAGHEDAPKS